MIVCMPAVLTIALSSLFPTDSSSAETRVDLSGRKGETVFFVLGMLDEYLGRTFVEDSDRVESFYCSEHVPAFVFRAYLDRLVREQGLHPAVETQWRQGCLVSFRSKEVSAFINQFYSYELSGSVRAVVGEERKRSATASLSWEQLEGRDRALQLAYLAGAYIRYGSDGRIRFANASEKRDLVAKVLVELACTNIRTSSREGLPHQNEVSFTPTGEVQNAFAQMPGEWALQTADSLVGSATSEELTIYREVLEVAQQGHFDGCPLPGAFAMRRFTSIPMVTHIPIPRTSQEQREALDDYDRASVTLRSVAGLASDSVQVSNVIGEEAPTVSLGRIGFSRSRRTAVAFLSYSSGADTDRCLRVAAAFLEWQRGKWTVTGYSAP